MISEAFGAHLGYLAVLIGTLLEGEAVLFLAGLAAQHGYLSFLIVAAVGAVGGFVADQSLFFIGRRFGNRLLVRFPSVAARAPRVTRHRMSRHPGAGMSRGRSAARPRGSDHRPLG